VTVPSLSKPSHPKLATIDGWELNIASRSAAVEELGQSSVSGLGYMLVCMNLDHLAKLRTDMAFREVYRHPAARIMADGAPVAVLARMQNSAVQRSPGPDLMVPLCHEAARLNLPIAVFGTRPEVMALVCTKLQADCKGLQIAMSDAPRFGFDPTSAEADAAADAIAASGAKIVLLGLGSPKQEMFALRAIERHPHLGFICIGAALDFFVGEQQRAPQVMRDLGIEWAWRLANNPRRLAHRYWLCGVLLADLTIRLPLLRRLGLSNSAP
jgi:N-acetylglucosaminyldiphosphoundecaprenol N-acetyl-beta-D-mannosaminyltransferase